uniref:Putative solute carrier family 35 member c2 n=1 Tax=Triatoma dimidiata TaxID=72491 RepID=A0A0V0G906_TRIDM
MARVVLNDASGNKTFLQISNKGYMWTLINASGIILLYFPLSIGLTFYQRWFLQRFHYPLLVVMFHLMTKFFMAAIFRYLWQCWYRRQRIKLDWPNTIRKIAPMGFVSGLDIAFSNWGLEFITVSLYTMTKSTSIIFILFFALLFKLEEKSWSLIFIVAMISGGLIMFTYKATQFDLMGFLLVLFASFSSGIRWTLAQFVMQRAEMGLSNPLDMLYHVQPWMFISILPFMIAFEAGVAIHGWHMLTFPEDMPLVWFTILYITVGSVIALAMELSEYLVISRMSSLTLSVASIFKEVCTLILAFEWNGDRMSGLNFVGLLCCLGGIICHVVHKTTKTAKINAGQAEIAASLNKPLLDEASARFLADVTTSTDEEDDDHGGENSSTEVLFSVLHSRDR